MMFLVLVLNRITRVLEPIVGVKGRQVRVALRIRCSGSDLLVGGKVCIPAETGRQVNGSGTGQGGFDRTGVLSRTLKEQTICRIDLRGGARGAREYIRELHGGTRGQRGLLALTSIGLRGGGRNREKGGEVFGRGVRAARDEGSGGLVEALDMRTGEELLLPG